MTTKTYTGLDNFYEVQHPLLQHKLSVLRDENTDKKE